MVCIAHLAAHLARAADDICAAFAASLAALKAEEAFDQAKEAILSGTSTTQAASLRAFLLLSRGRWVYDVHFGGRRGLGSNLRVHVGWKEMGR